MASELNKSWKTLLERRLQLLDAVKAGIARGLEHAEQTVKIIEAEETILTNLEALDRKTRVEAKSTVAGAEKEKKLLQLYRKKGGLPGSNPAHALHAARTTALAKLDGEALPLAKDLVNAERDLAANVIGEKTAIDAAKTELQALVDDWKEASRLIDTLPTVIKSKNFEIKDANAYADIITKFTDIHTKAGAAKTEVINEEQLNNKSADIADKIKALLDKIEEIDEADRDALLGASALQDIGDHLPGTGLGP
tara:strand:- start:2 stop:757 length:756 start_codon:yes stop_codon:yes gene_type:complete